MHVMHRQSEEFDERNLFLQITLGMLSLAERLDALLAREAVEPVPERSDDRSGDAPHPMELALLGAIATTQRLRQHLAALPPPPWEEPAPTPTERLPAPNALRQLLT
jgi:hypothetical protein